MSITAVPPAPALDDPCTPADASAPRTVLDAARERMDRILDDFDTVVVAFSGGKDSGVMLHLLLDRMRERGLTRPVHVFHLDYEGQYTATTRFVDEMLTAHPDLVVPWRVCLPVAAGCAATMYEDHWRPWAPEERALWVREMPDHPGVLHTGNLPEGFPPYEGVPDYEFQEEMVRWLHRHTGARRTAVLVGIRSQESLHRYAAIHRADKHAMHDGLRWTSTMGAGVVKAYPVHDWLLDDVWHAHARFGWSYNPLYDLLHQAGVAPHQMRVASPFISQGLHQLRLYREIEPEMWARLVGRVNGANFAAIYGATGAMAARSVKLPKGHTWKSYLRLLLDTLPERARTRYLTKFATSVRYWTIRGGALRTTTVRALQAAGVPAEYLGKPRSARRYSVPHEMVRFFDYPDELPGIRDASSVPTYKRMCVTVLRNDYTCRSMGFGPTKSERESRDRAMATYEEVLG
jgi:predicted phosphoadenosine phosphosulfate sulfurtransferase